VAMNESKNQIEKKSDALTAKVSSVLSTISLAKEAYEQGRVKLHDYPKNLPFAISSVASA